MLDRRKRCCWINRHSHAHIVRPNEIQGSVQMHLASAWTVSIVAPASTKAGMYWSGSEIIRWTSRAALCDLSDCFHDGRPDRDVRDKMPIHHVHVQQVRAGLFDLAMSSPNAAKFAERIEGAIRMLTGSHPEEIESFLDKR